MRKSGVDALPSTHASRGIRRPQIRGVIAVRGRFRPAAKFFLSLLRLDARAVRARHFSAPRLLAWRNRESPQRAQHHHRLTLCPWGFYVRYREGFRARSSTGFDTRPMSGAGLLRENIVDYVRDRGKRLSCRPVNRGHRPRGADRNRRVS